MKNVLYFWIVVEFFPLGADRLVLFLLGFADFRFQQKTALVFSKVDIVEPLPQRLKCRDAP
ncbi:hypothetical protein DKG75_18715 [Zavarzinia compransoris]|uniref:Uncharacterized protein n=1 Tax=Zavarzinia compransoris TaxID=1264899 RepID=A0A317DWV0_9PROT|nr:hypothetical protein DKG75_18715 [Zavarzinia compransoris]